MSPLKSQGSCFFVKSLNTKFFLFQTPSYFALFSLNFWRWIFSPFLWWRLTFMTSSAAKMNNGVLVLHHKLISNFQKSKCAQIFKWNEKLLLMLSLMSSLFLNRFVYSLSHFRSEIRSSLFQFFFLLLLKEEKFK